MQSYLTETTRKTGAVRALSREEFERVRRYAAQYMPEMEPIFCLASLTGMSARELSRLAWKDVDQAAGFIKVAGRQVPILPAAEQVLERLPPFGVYVFSSRSGSSLEASEIKSAWSRATRLLGESLSFESLSCTFAVWAHACDIPEALIERWTGQDYLTLSFSSGESSMAFLGL